MRNKPLFVFTHIQKTAGTSFFDRVVRPNFADSEILETSIREFWHAFGAHHHVVTGHVGYGLHWFSRRDPTYVTFLRHPIERAVSHYYFIRQCDPAYCTHDRYPDAQAYDLAAFYSHPRYQNEMTRMLAGFPFERIAAYTNTRHFDSWAYRLARHRLARDYDSFGIKERFEESAKYIASRYGWISRPHGKRKKRTRGRPSLSDLDAATRRTLRDAHQYDLRLYNYACRLLDARLLGSSESAS